MSIKAKQVAGVTSLVVGVVMALSAYHMATLARLSLEDTASRGQMLATAIFHRFWQKTDPLQRNVSRITLLGNMAILGGLCLLLQNILNK